MKIRTLTLNGSFEKKSSGYSIISKSYNLCLLEKLVKCNLKEKDRLLNK